MKIKTLLCDEIEEEIKELGQMGIGTEQYKITVEGITKLTDRIIEMDKIDMEFDNRFKEEENELMFKTQQLNEEKKDRFNKNCISVIGIILPLGITVWGALKSWEFEKEGIVTSSMGKGFMNKLLPKK